MYRKLNYFNFWAIHTFMTLYVHVQCNQALYWWLRRKFLNLINFYLNLIVFTLMSFFFELKHVGALLYFITTWLIMYIYFCYHRSGFINLDKPANPSSHEVHCIFDTKNNMVSSLLLSFNVFRCYWMLVFLARALILASIAWISHYQPNIFHCTRIQEVFIINLGYWFFTKELKASTQ